MLLLGSLSRGGGGEGGVGWSLPWDHLDQHPLQQLGLVQLKKIPRSQSHPSVCCGWDCCYIKGTALAKMSCPGGMRRSRAGVQEGMQGLNEAAALERCGMAESKGSSPLESV